MSAEKRHAPAGLVLFGGLAVGLLAGALITSFWFVRRNHRQQALPPEERAKRLIESCEEKIQEIQRSLEAQLSR